MDNSQTAAVASRSILTVGEGAGPMIENTNGEWGSILHALGFRIPGLDIDADRYPYDLVENIIRTKMNRSANVIVGSGASLWYGRVRIGRTAKYNSPTLKRQVPAASLYVGGQLWKSTDTSVTGALPHYHSRTYMAEDHPWADPSSQGISEENPIVAELPPPNPADGEETTALWLSGNDVCVPASVWGNRHGQLMCHSWVELFDDGKLTPAGNKSDTVTWKRTEADWKEYCETSKLANMTLTRAESTPEMMEQLSCPRFYLVAKTKDVLFRFGGHGEPRKKLKKNVVTVWSNDGVNWFNMYVTAGVPPQLVKSPVVRQLELPAADAGDESLIASDGMDV